MSRILSFIGKNKKFNILFGAIFLLSLPNTIYGASIYNSDFEPQRVRIEYKDKTYYFVTVYNSSTHYFDCTKGCQVRLVRTGHTKTLEADTVVIIDDGKLRVR